MNECDFEIDKGSRDGLHSVKQEDPILKDERKLVAQERQGPHAEEEQVGGCSCHKRTVVKNERRYHFYCGNLVIDSANEHR